VIEPYPGDPPLAVPGMTRNERELLCEVGRALAHALERKYIDSGGDDERDLDHAERIRALVNLVSNAAAPTVPEGTE
jgi:hypothetical protein